MKHRILIVEDDAINRQVLTMWLQRIGDFDIEEATNGEEALEMVEDNPPDCILMDLKMPLLDGWDDFVAHVLRSPFQPPTAPLLMARFAPKALRSTTSLARTFRTPAARALLAGNAAHAGTPLELRLPGAIGATLMAAGHAVGWPIPRRLLHIVGRGVPALPTPAAASTMGAALMV